VQVGDLLAAFALSALIGLERELRNKSAGLRTNAVIGVASALFVQVSKYGFADVVGGSVRLDPSRVAAQVVTGIGFVGAGLIFVRRGDVRGLTTAATVWLTAAVGMACGAGLPALAAIITAMHLFIVFVLSYFEHTFARHALRICVETHDPGVALALAQQCRAHGFEVRRVEAAANGPGSHAVTLWIKGRRAVEDVVAFARDVAGIESFDVQLEGEEIDERPVTR
jgi:putative Mg2+ transporter-C (MgtC) family protein